jgi:hypothetical protein
MGRRRLHIKDYSKGSSPYGVKLLEIPGVKSYHKDFKPDFTPDVMIRMGVFGGLGVKGIETEIPIEWLLYSLFDKNVGITYTNMMFADQRKNYYKVISSVYPSSDGKDSRLFFHWYCRYYLGKRSEEDEDMIKTWMTLETLRERVLKSLPSECLLDRQFLFQHGYRV